MKKLANNEKLSRQYKVHRLKGEYSDCCECHIEPDWLLIYLNRCDEIVFIRTGSHAELFR